MQITDLIGYHLRRAEAVTKSDYARVTSDIRVSPAQFSALAVICKNPGLMQSDLARAIGVDNSAIVHIIDALEAKNLVSRERHKTNRRRRLVYIKQDGIDAYNIIRKRLDATNRIRLASLTDKEQSLLMHYLYLIYAT